MISEAMKEKQAVQYADTPEKYAVDQFLDFVCKCNGIVNNRPTSARSMDVTLSDLTPTFADLLAPRQVLLNVDAKSG
jgi:hypothetical protein